MLTYEYFCQANEKTVEVAHSMRDSIATWGELCQRAGIEPGSTASDAPVERLISGGAMAIVSGGTPSSQAALPTLPMGGGCCGRPSQCGHH
ncbi:hypothetical protein [Planctellipticum variicoloris]|uniref:hypothetical protein n=1 Tax=Planctellipticum variicoloris TaxID=3064265 RepID=UPI002B733886|nr:hypothetical protein SH412_002266 [Planctomycetaceae bacterium SH412]HTN03207.1 hypothetical protein [Planctomycetaceae bacterium]